MKCNSDTQPSWEPIGDLAIPAGYTASAEIQTNRTNRNSKENFNALSKVADEIMRDPLQTRQLADRVYELMLEDLRNQKERSRGCGRVF